MPDARKAEPVRVALTASIATLPEQLRRSLTCDQAKEMAEHARFSIDSDLRVYFCDPRSPWQRASNENTNGLLRQYLLRKSNLAITQARLDEVAAQVNGRPRKTLIDVNAVRNDVDWSWDGSHVGQMACDKSYGWFALSGWQMVDNTFLCAHENSQTRSRSSSFAHYRNSLFCALNVTDTVYDRNNVYGMADGSLRGVSTVTNTGGCTSLLSVFKELRRTL